MRQRIVWGSVFVLVVALMPATLHAGEKKKEEKEAAEQAKEAMHRSGDVDQEAMMEAYEKAATPGQAHAKLADHAGTWNATVKMWMEPGGEPMVTEGSFEREMILGGRVLEERYEGTFMGETFTGHGQTGYDNVRGKFWATWADSMSTGPMISWGEWDEEIGGVVYRAESSNPMTGEVSKSKIVVTHPEEGKEVMTMYELHDGQEVKTMEITSVRQGSAAASDEKKSAESSGDGTE